jgi:hypothetical protein
MLERHLYTSSLVIRAISAIAGFGFEQISLEIGVKFAEIVPQPKVVTHLGGPKRCRKL